MIPPSAAVKGRLSLIAELVIVVAAAATVTRAISR
jgi:hypothetical protein